MIISFDARRVATALAIAVSSVGAERAAAQAQTESPPDEVIVTGVPHQRAPGELAQSVSAATSSTAVAQRRSARRSRIRSA